MVVIDFHSAEIRIILLNAVGQGQRNRHTAVACLDAVAIEIGARRDRPVQRHRAAAVTGGLKPEDLVGGRRHLREGGARHTDKQQDGGETGERKPDHCSHLRFLIIKAARQIVPPA